MRIGEEMTGTAATGRKAREEVSMERSKVRRKQSSVGGCRRFQSPDRVGRYKTAVQRETEALVDKLNRGTC